VRPGQAHADRHPQQLGARSVRRRPRGGPGWTYPAAPPFPPLPRHLSACAAHEVAWMPPDEVRGPVWRCGGAISTVPACCLHDRTAVRL